MKRIISIMLCLSCLCALVALPVAAAPIDPMAVKFQKFLDKCDSLYDGDVIKLVLTDAMKAFAPQENLEDPVEISATDFETELEKYIVLSDAVLNEIRSPEKGLYDSENRIYILQFPEDKELGPVQRQYRGYVKTGENTYSVYYQEFEREDLGSTEIISQYKNPITGNVEYSGKVYVRDSKNIYYCVKSWKDGGNKYNLEMIDGKMRFISGESFGADQLPTAFDDAIITYDLPKDDTVYLDDVAYFPDQTIVKVERITGVVREIAQAMESVSTRYAPYAFTATHNGNPVEPGSKMKVHFVVPENFGANTVVMHLDAEGKLTELASMVKNIEGTSYLVTELEHFSTYLLVDKDAKPVAPTTESTVAPTAEPTAAPTTVVTQVTTEGTKTTVATQTTNATTQATNAPTQDTNATTQATNAPTQDTNATTQASAAPDSKPTSVTVVRPTVSPTWEVVSDPTKGTTVNPTAQTAVDPTEETAVAPTQEVAPTDEATVAPTEVPKPAKTNPTGGIVAAVIVVIVLAGGGFAAWWFYFRKKKEQEETEEKTEE